jgi:hypothetical protein
MFDGIQAWLNSPAPIFYFLVFAWILWSSARRLDKRIAKIETDKDKAESDAWWAKWEEGSHEYRQVYSNSVRKNGIGASARQRSPSSRMIGDSAL